MVTQVAHRSEMVYPTNAELHSKTENILTQITKKKDWSLENSQLENWEIKSIYLAGAGIMGSVAAWSIPSSVGYILRGTPSPYSYSNAMLLTGFGMMNLLNSAEDKNRVSHLSNELKGIAASYKQDKDPTSQVIAEKLEKIIKTANAYIESRSYGEYGLASTLILTGAAGMAAESGYLPESLKAAAFVVGITGTTTLSFCHHMYKGQGLQKVSQRVNECLKMLEQQKHPREV
jgi:hypothetical protein